MVYIQFPSLPAMRWKIQLRYLGTAYCGWQRQPNDPSVQQTLEEAFALILRQPVEIVGCGRTDTGVHARSYTAHTDVVDVLLTDKLIYQINAVLPADIAIQHMKETSPGFHSRFDAIERQYLYHIHFQKDPFLHGLSYYLHQHSPLNQQKMNEAAALILQYNQFKPFCKTGSDADHFKCILSESAWIFSEEGAMYSIKANRFLRGMVRLIVGACLNIGLGKTTIDELNECLEKQSLLPHAWSVPAEGLYLENVVYPES